MEKEKYIETIINSTNGITKVAPSDDLFSKIEMKIQSTTNVSTSTLWLVAASIIVLVTINVSVIMKSNTKSESQIETSLATTLNKSNQLY